MSVNNFQIVDKVLFKTECSKNIEDPKAFDCVVDLMELFGAVKDTRDMGFFGVHPEWKKSIIKYLENISQEKVDGYVNTPVGLILKIRLMESLSAEDKTNLQDSLACDLSMISNNRLMRAQHQILMAREQAEKPPAQKIYIAGPISGDKDKNREAFFSMESRLKADGHIVLNPAVLPDGLTEAECMQIDLSMLMIADAICLLDGWKQSPGAMAEYHLAYKLNKQVLIPGEGLRPIEPAVA